MIWIFGLTGLKDKSVSRSSRAPKKQNCISGLPFQIWPSVRDVERVHLTLLLLLRPVWPSQQVVTACKGKLSKSHLLFHPADTPMIYHLSGHFIFSEFVNLQYHHNCYHDLVDRKEWVAWVALSNSHQCLQTLWNTILIVMVTINDVIYDHNDREPSIKRGPPEYLTRAHDVGRTGAASGKAQSSIATRTV